MKTTFDSLPHELVSEILSGDKLETVLNLSRVSRHFRTLIFNSSQVWIKATDAYLLPLPMGETVETIDPSKLAALAARAISLSRKLSSPTADPLHYYPIDYKNGSNPQENLAALPHLHFLPGNEWLVIRTSGGMTLQNVHDVRNSKPQRSWDIGSKGYARTCVSSKMSIPNQIVLVASIERGTVLDHKNYIEIFLLQFGSETDEPIIERKLSCQLELPGYLVNIAVREELVAIMGKHRRVIIINWKEGYYQRIAPLDMISPPSGLGLQPFAIAFHPIRASLILGIQSGMTGRKHTLEMVDVPSAWEPLPPDAAILFSSATECVSPPYEVLYEFEELPEYANVHLENGSPVIDLVTRKRISQGTKVIDESLLPIYHYSLPSTEAHPVESARRLQGVFTQSSMFNVPFNQEIYLPYVQVADCGFLKPSQGPQWVNLQLSVLPDELLSRFRNPLAFDPLTGSLYIFIYGPGLCLIQY